jgi:hypothetical protein
MDVRVVGKQTFLRSMEEVCAVIDGSLFTRRATEDLRLPSVTISSVSGGPQSNF